MHDYWNYISRFAEAWRLPEPRLYQSYSLRTFWMMLVPSSTLESVLYLVSAVTVLVFAVRCWRSSLPLGLRYAALLLATVLVSPHLTVYDLVILAPAFLLTADWVVSHRAVSRALCGFAYCAYLLPLLGPLAEWTHLQLSVVAFFGWIWTIWWITRSSKTTVQNQKIAEAIT